MAPPNHVLSSLVPVCTASTSYLVTIPNLLAPPFKARKRSAYSFVAVAVTMSPFTRTTSSSLNASAENPCSAERKLRPPPRSRPVPTVLLISRSDVQIQRGFGVWRIAGLPHPTTHRCNAIRLNSGKSTSPMNPGFQRNSIP